MEDPWKRWKLTAEDFRNSARRADYEAAIDDMLERTSTAESPWRLIPAEHKRYGRIAALQTVADALAAGVDLSPPPLSPEVAELARARFGAD
jgi:polyphosphate kinase 2 (PPK2 family)